MRDRCDESFSVRHTMSCSRSVRRHDNDTSQCRRRVRSPSVLRLHKRHPFGPRHGAHIAADHVGGRAGTSCGITRMSSRSRSSGQARPGCSERYQNVEGCGPPVVMTNPATRSLASTNGIDQAHAASILGSAKHGTGTGRQDRVRAFERGGMAAHPRRNARAAPSAPSTRGGVAATSAGAS